MYIIKDLPFDQLLIDVHPKTGNLVNWAEKKFQTNQLADICCRLAEKKQDPRFKSVADRLRKCGFYLEFLEHVKTREKRLIKASFCRYRGCFMCNWRKSLKHYGQLSQIMDVATSKGYRYLFATMSIQNCTGEEMKQQITDLYKGYTNLTRRVAVKKALKGTMRTLEITHNVDPTDKWYDTYNVHLHAIFAVEPDYFKHGYIKQAQWLKFWKESMNVSYEPHFHIKAVKAGKDNGAIREVSKYATKSSHVLSDNPELAESAVFYIDQALINRRLISYTGVFKDIKAKLGLEDVETGDLVKTDIEDDERYNDALEWTLQVYKWGYGYNQYIRVDKSHCKSERELKRKL